ncbi:MAG: 3'(2'),5'-bisphosphate nucleotidase CysQ [Pseudanabaenaceae cyanobacterium]|jgi:3'(2'), 5'-bisphosphate nucleotidase
MMNLQEILAVVRPIAWGAGDILMQYYNAPDSLDIQSKGDEGNVTAADLAANDFILQQLQAHFPTAEFGYLSEEVEDSTHRLGKEWVWIIDPMDGTSNFIDRSGQFAVHIGLTYQQRPVLGVVGCPVRGVLFQAIQGLGAFMEDRDGNQTQIHVSPQDQLDQMVLVASGSHRSELMDKVIRQLPIGAEILVGSLGIKLTTIAEGRADFYLSISGNKSAPKDWDYCAPEIILSEAGGRLSRFDGSDLTYNNLEIRQFGAILGSNGNCHAQLCERSQEALALFR